MELKPVKYRYRKDTDSTIHYGLIAQDVEKSMTANKIDRDFAGLVKTQNEADKNDVMYNLNYTEFIPILIRIVQEQQNEIEKLKKR